MMNKKPKTINCSQCKTEILKKAKICPNCGCKNKKPFYKKIWFWILIIIVISNLGHSVNDKSKVSNYMADEKNQNNISDSDIKDFIIDEQIIYSDNDVKISTTGNKSSGNDVEIGIYIENNSNLNLGFNAHSYAVNTIATKNNIFSMDVDVAAGKKANTTLKIKKSFLNEFDITDIKQIDVLFWAYDNDKLMKEFDTGQITLYTNKSDDNLKKIKGTEIYNSGGISVDYLYNEGNDYTFVLHNNTDSYFDFDIENLSVNDYTITNVDFDLRGINLLKNCQCLLTIKLRDDFIKENNIDDVHKITFNMNIRPYGDYFSDYSTDLIQYSK